MLGVLRACQRGIGVAMLPDYLVEENGGLVQLFGESDTTIALDAYFVYPEELKIGRARAGVPRLSGHQGAALEFLADVAGATATPPSCLNDCRMAGMQAFVLCEKIAAAYCTHWRQTVAHPPRLQS